MAMKAAVVGVAITPGPIPFRESTASPFAGRGAATPH